MVDRHISITSPCFHLVGANILLSHGLPEGKFPHRTRRVIPLRKIYNARLLWVELLPVKSSVGPASSPDTNDLHDFVLSLPIKQAMASSLPTNIPLKAPRNNP